MPRLSNQSSLARINGQKNTVRQLRQASLCPPGDDAGAALHHLFARLQDHDSERRLYA